MLVNACHASSTCRAIAWSLGSLWLVEWILGGLSKTMLDKIYSWILGLTLICVGITRCDAVHIYHRSQWYTYSMLPLVAIPTPTPCVLVFPNETNDSQGLKYCLNSVGSSSSLISFTGVFGSNCLADKNPFKLQSTCSLFNPLSHCDYNRLQLLLDTS